jgi:hypothetical protein
MLSQLMLVPCLLTIWGCLAPWMQCTNDPAVLGVGVPDAMMGHGVQDVWLPTVLLMLVLFLLPESFHHLLNWKAAVWFNFWFGYAICVVCMWKYFMWDMEHCWLTWAPNVYLFPRLGSLYSQHSCSLISAINFFFARVIG